MEIQRRSFLKRAASAIAASSVWMASRQVVKGAQGEETSPRPKLKKAVKLGMVHGDLSLVEKFRLLKELGFDGVEMDSPSSLERADVLKARDEAGLPIHGVVDSVHWRSPLSHADPKVRGRGVEALRMALKDSKAYGGTSVLLVPAVVNKEISYEDAYRRSQAEIRKVLPMAEELKVHIAIENVWNNFLLSPLELARYLDEFDSPWVGAYFDVGNVVRYGWPEQWIRILGKRILKLDIKEYSRKKQFEEGTGKGFDVKIGDGDCDWPAVMQAIAETGFQGWATAEVRGGGRERLADIARRMDQVLRST
jgi:L-ribulose-5-phosphate 3-epimerase